MEKISTNNWFGIAKEKIDEGARKLNISSSTLTESAIALGSGFVIGYLAKKYGRPILVSAFMLIVALVILNYFSVITIEWSKTKALIGLSPNDDAHAILNHMGQWIKDHTIAVVVGAIAFLIGYSIR
ncbi:MAG TPA: FUN14 domain-containing protein [Candidatus Babeliales bacterium]|nr:FUN14 domain-containing protein [Candidatus Babeliales bacterium]